MRKHKLPSQFCAPILYLKFILQLYFDGRGVVTCGVPLKPKLELKNIVLKFIVLCFVKITCLNKKSFIYETLCFYMILRMDFAVAELF